VTPDPKTGRVLRAFAVLAYAVCVAFALVTYR
jgi:hypothetical protein